MGLAVGMWCVLVTALLLTPLATHASTPRLRAVTHVWRHGDRAPQQLYPKWFNQSQWWPLGLEQLTGKGMWQAYELGRRIRARYVDELGVLKSSWLSTQMQSRSSGVARCLMTATDVYYGLFPLGTGPLNSVNQSETIPERFQAVPIQTVPLTDEKLLRPWSVCPEYQRVRLDVVETSPEWKAKELQYQSLIEKVGQAIGQQFALGDIYFVYDSFATAISHNRPLPPSLSKTDVAEFLSLAQWATGQQLGANKAVLPFLTSNFFQQLQDDFTSVLTSGDSNTQFFHYSAHDWTLMPIGIASGIWPPDIVPPYTTCFAFEMYVDNSTSPSTVSVRFYVDDFSTPKSLSWCDGLTSCPLTRFYSYIQQYALSDWDSSCGNPSPFGPTSSNSIWTIPAIISTVFAVLLSVIVVVTLVLYCTKRRKSEIVYTPV